MIFLNSSAFLLLTLLIFIYFYNKHKSKNLPFTDEILDKIETKSTLHTYRKHLFLIVYLILIFIIARPVIIKEIILDDKFAKVEILLDVSNSMKIIDGEKSHFEVAKERIKKLMNQDRDRYALSLFANGVLHLTPLSEDIKIIESILDSVDIDSIDIEEINIENLNKYDSKYNILVVTDRDLDIKNKNILNILKKDTFTFSKDFEVVKRIEVYEELFYYPLMVAIVLFLFAI